MERPGDTTGSGALIIFRIMKLKAILVSLIIGAATAGWAATTEFTANAFGAPEQAYGFNKAQTYDVAVLLSDPDLTGKKVTGLRVNTSASESLLTDVCGWLSTELKTKTQDGVKVNDPDICTVKATCHNGVIEATFAEPVEIPAEGLYVGYSLTQETPGDLKPIAVAEGNTAGGFFLHATVSQLKWSDYGKREGLVSAMTVLLEGDMAAEAAVATLPAKVYMSREAGVTVPVTFYNHGSSPVSSIEYEYSYGSQSGKGSWTAPEAIPSVFGRGSHATISLPAAQTAGEATFSFSITAVNGSPNQSLSGNCETAVEVLDFIAINRPLVEEFTGLHCGWCPRGYVMMEQGKLYYGDRFVALSYHSTGYESGAMTCIDPEDFPIYISGYPSASINRSGSIDPGSVLARWTTLAEQPASCDVSVSLSWADEAHTTLKAVSKARFLRDIDDCRYVWSVALLADGLSNPKWAQSNAYADYEATGEYTGPFWDLFIGKEDRVTGLTFNDIVVWYPEIKGIAGSMPETVKAGEYYEYETLIPVDEVVNLEGEHIVSDFGKVRAVGIVLDKVGGIPVNCASSTYVGGSGMADAVAAEVVAREYYSLQGLRVERPGKGIYILVETLSDGTRLSRKVMR